MTTKYFEIDSTYRNREAWPTPSQFQVLIAPSSSNNAISALDPVSLAAPDAQWESNMFDSTTSGTPSISGVIIGTGYGAANSSDLIVFTAPNLQMSENYYRSSVISTIANGVSRVLYYNYIGNNTAQIIPTEPVTFPIGTTITLTDPTDISLGLIFVPNSSSELANAYTSDIIYNETLAQSSIITFFNPISGVVSITPNLPGWLSTDIFSLRKQIPLFSGITGLASTANQINFIPPLQYDFVGSFIRLLPVYPEVLPHGEIRRISSFNSITNTATINPPFSSPAPLMNFEILPFSYDNFNPFVFTGTPQQEFITYSISLIEIVVPNKLVLSGSGGRAWKYPFLYVEFYPINTMPNNIMCSNNPNSKRVLFRVTIGNFDTFRTSNFVHLTGDGTKQKVKFMIETDFMFSLKLPNGQIFENISQDSKSPNSPLPELQISAMFEIIRE